MSLPTPSADLAPVRVWDLPTRIFHWSLLACVAGAFATGLVGGGLMNWHGRLGYAIAGLLAFRLVWVWSARRIRASCPSFRGRRR